MKPKTQKFSLIINLILGIITLYVAGVPTLLFSETTQFLSKYTNLTKCKVLIKPGEPDAGGPNDSYLAQCPGRDGYAIYNEGGDSRDWLVIKKGEKVLNLQGLGEGDVFFTGVAGSKLEWRYRVSGKQKELVALILRVGGNEHSTYEDGDLVKYVSFLYTVRLNSENYCILGKGKNNEEAHQLADGEQKPLRCVKYNESKWDPLSR